MKTVNVIAFLMLLLGSSCLLKGQSLSDSTLQTLKVALQSATHDTTRLMVATEICEYYIRVNTLDSALVYGLKAAKISWHYPDVAIVPVLWLKISYIYSHLSRKVKDEETSKAYLKESFTYTQKALADAHRLRNDEVSLKAAYNLAHYYAGADSIYLFFKTSLTLLNQIESKATYSSLDTFILRNLLGLICEVSDYDMRSPRYNTYLNTSKRFTPKTDKHYESLCLMELEQTAKFLGKDDEQRFLQKYDSLKREFKNPNFIAQLTIELAEYYFQIKDYKKSFDISHRILKDVHIDSLDEYHRLQCTVSKHLLLGKNAYMLSKNAKAISTLHTSLAYMEKGAMAMITEKHTAYLYLSKAYEKANDYKNAMLYIKKAEEVYSQINNHQTQALLAESDVQLEQLRQEKKVQAAHTQVLLKEREAQVAHRQRNILLFLFAGVLALSLGLVYNYSRLRKLNKTVTQQAAALAASNVLKDKIFALLSHDLRSPINRLMRRVTPTYDAQLSAIQSDIKSVQDILNNILHWSTMQLKGLHPVATSIPLRAFLQSIIDEYYSDLQLKNLTLLNSIAPDTELTTDENYLKIILRNLISNAIKFTDAGGFVQIDSEPTTEGLAITVKDTGVGMNATKLSTVFQLPTPAEGTQQEKGTGLGLSLSLDIAQKLGGSITVQSEEQRGTRVTILLPHKAVSQKKQVSRDVIRNVSTS